MNDLEDVELSAPHEGDSPQSFARREAARELRLKLRKERQNLLTGDAEQYRHRLGSDDPYHHALRHDVSKQRFTIEAVRAAQSPAAVTAPSTTRAQTFATDSDRSERYMVAVREGVGAAPSRPLVFLKDVMNTVSVDHLRG